MRGIKRLFATACLTAVVSAAPRAVASPPGPRFVEDQGYSQRETRSSGLERFTGGGWVPDTLILPRESGTGEPASQGEMQAYAQREAAAQELEDFTGGSFGEVIIVLALLAAIVIIVYLVMEQKK